MRVINTGGGGSSAIPDVVTLADAPTLPVNASVTDIASVTLTQAATVLNPTGSIVDGQKLMYRISTASSRALAWDTTFRTASTAPLPAATAIGQNYYTFYYVTADTKWDYVATEGNTAGGSGLTSDQVLNRVAQRA